MFVWNFFQRLFARQDSHKRHGDCCSEFKICDACAEVSKAERALQQYNNDLHRASKRKQADPTQAPLVKNRLITPPNACTINPLGIQPSPLVLNSNHEVIHPSSSSYMAFIHEFDWIRMGCPDDQLIYNGKILNTTSFTALCVGNSLFDLGDRPVDFYSFRCHSSPRDTIGYTGQSCTEGGEEIKIGYDLGDNDFIRQMTICFDKVIQVPVYSYYTLTKNIGYRDNNVPKKYFQDDGFYAKSLNLDALYNRDNQRRTINDLLGLDCNSEKYIKAKGDLFINRGHLTPKGDFVYGFQQLATYHYVNSAPQWASFNGGYWKEVENSVRDYANLKGVDLEIYTGVHGVTSLPHSTTGQQTKIFLHTGNQNLVPVPQLFWKIIYNKNTTEGIAVVGINNPYEVDLSNDVICPDISENVSWFNKKLKRQKGNIELGYTYACSIPDFH